MGSRLDRGRAMPGVPLGCLGVPGPRQEGTEMSTTLLRCGGMVAGVLTCLMMVAGLQAHAQEDQLAPDGEAAVQPAPMPMQPPPAAPPQPSAPAGDVVTLKSGQVLQGYQVLRRTPKHLEIEILPGVEPLRVPRGQVESVVFDDYDLLRERRRQALFPQDDALDLLPGQKLSADLSRKLATDISTVTGSYLERDLMEVLTDLGQKLDVAIEFGDFVKAAAPQDRVWTLQVEPNTTLLSSSWAIV